MISFLCIGAQKAGTTWLIDNLKMHPKVWTPNFVKELHYFDSIHLETNKSFIIESYKKKMVRLKKLNPKLRSYYNGVIDPELVFTDRWYQHVFSAAPKGSCTGECTPMYSCLDQTGIDHVKILLPNIKLIYMIRNPLDRLISSFQMTMSRREISDGNKLIMLLNNKLFLRRGDYQRNIPLWERNFEKSNILFIPFGKIKSNPQQILRDVENYLDIPNFDGYDKKDQKIHQTKKEGMVMGDEVIEKMKALTKVQDEYLIERFGEEFFSMTK